jgi:phage anti-repressor protein
MSNQITVVMPHDKTQVQVNVSKVFEALAPVLPIVSRLFASDAKEDATIDTRDLHKALNVGRNHSTWWNGVVDRFRLVEGTHFVTVEEPVTLRGNKIPVHYYVSLNVARHLQQNNNKMDQH